MNGISGAAREERVRKMNARLSAWHPDHNSPLMQEKCHEITIFLNEVRKEILPSLTLFSDATRQSTPTPPAMTPPPLRTLSRRVELELYMLGWCSHRRPRGTFTACAKTPGGNQPAMMILPTKICSEIRVPYVYTQPNSVGIGLADPSYRRVVEDADAYA